MRQEADARVAVEQFLQASIAGDEQYADGRYERYPHIAVALHFHQYHRAHNQSHACQHLVGNAEQRPERVNAAQRVGYAGVEEVAPQGHGEEGGN